MNLPDLKAANQRVSTYLCGDCGYQATARWAAHQLHYQRHAEGKTASRHE